MTVYRERLWAPPSLYLATALVIPASLLVFLPINVATGVIVAACMELAALVFLFVMAPTIEVTDAELRVGHAHIPRSAIGQVSAYFGAEATTQRGRKLDARAWTLFRGYLKDVVKVEVRDERDPTPYWLVSARHPDRIVEALGASRNASTNRRQG